MENRIGVRFFNPGKGYQAIKPEIDEAITRVLTNGDLILRKDGDEFEHALAAYCGSKYAVGLNSGTDALYLSLWALGVKPGDEVLVPSHTFVATAQVVAQLGAIPQLYDMDGNMEIRERTRGVIVAHIAGQMEAEMQRVVDEAKRRGLWVVEDACQALGASQNGKMAGSFGITGCFSFYPAKILGAYGDAGAIVTDDFEMYHKISELRNHWKKDYSQWGINSRLDNIQAAVLNVKLKHLAANHARRWAIAKAYDEALKGLPITLPVHTEGRVWQDYVISLDIPGDRDKLFDFLKERSIETMKNEYPMPIEKLPLAKDYEARTLRIPCNDVVTDEEVAEVIHQIKQYFQ